MLRTHRLTALICTVALAICSPSSPGQQPGAARQRPPESFRVVPLALCEDYPEETRSIETVRKDFEVLRQTGVSYLRVSFGWDGIEPEDDRFDWAFWDEFMALAEQQGIRIVPYVCYTPAWAAADGEPDQPSYTRPPRSSAEFAEFVTALCTRYGDQVETWEIWNEPDNPAYWTGTREEYAALVKTGAEAVRRADPGAGVVLGGIAWDLDFLQELFLDHGIAPAVDVVGLHAYFETWIPGAAEDLTAYVNGAADIVAAHGENEPLWLNEIGYSTFRQGEYVSDIYTAVYGYEHTPEYQASFLLRSLALLHATKKLSLIAWYEIKDLPPGEQVIGDQNNRHLGITGPNHEPKPAMHALRFATDLFGGPVHPVDDRIRSLRPLDSQARIHAFIRGDGGLFVVAWLPTFVPGTIADIGEDPDGQAPDERRESIRLLLPSGLVPAGRQTASLYTETGRAAGRVRIAPPQSGTRAMDLSLQPGGVTVLRIEPSQ